MSILKWLGLGGGAAEGPSPSDTETVRKVIERLDRLEPDRARYIAAFAYVLGRVAHADRSISPDELRTMEGIVAGHGGLPEDQAVLVVQIARTQNQLFGGTENFLVTREFAKIATREQKLALLDSAFAVSAAQGGISTVEDNEIRRVADELLLEHADFIAVRSRYRDDLNVLRRDGGRTP